MGQQPEHLPQAIPGDATDRVESTEETCSKRVGPRRFARFPEDNAYALRLVELEERCEQEAGGYRSQARGPQPDVEMLLGADEHIEPPACS